MQQRSRERQRQVPDAQEEIVTHIVIKLEDCDTEETKIDVGGSNYAVARLEGNVFVIVDWSYRSYEEAAAAWPEVDGITTLIGEIDGPVHYDREFIEKVHKTFPFTSKIAGSYDGVGTPAQDQAIEEAAKPKPEEGGN
jgi:hypothetical protein